MLLILIQGCVLVRRPIVRRYERRALIETWVICFMITNVRIVDSLEALLEGVLSHNLVHNLVIAAVEVNHATASSSWARSLRVRELKVVLLLVLNIEAHLCSHGCSQDFTGISANFFCLLRVVDL